MEQLQEAASTYLYVYLFEVLNMKNEALKKVRAHWQGKGRFFMGKNKLMSYALGKEPSSEIKPNIYQLTQVPAPAPAPALCRAVPRCAAPQCVHIAAPRSAHCNGNGCARLIPYCSLPRVCCAASHRIASDVQRISGNACGLFFTDAKPVEVVKYVTLR